MYVFSLFLTGAILLLILAGGLVTSHQAGLAVPDWPLSYGQLFPPMVGNIFWEHGHRMIAGTVAVLTFILAVWVQCSEKRGWLKKLVWTAFGMVIAQALLGGLTVVLMLPDAVSILHACLAQTFFCVVIAIAYFLSPHFVSSPGLTGGSKMTSLQRLSFTTVGIIYIQLILGALVRHNGHPHAVATHVVIAFAVVAHVLMLSGRILKSFPGSALFTPAAGIGLATLVQFFLGIGSFVLTRMIEQSYAPSKAAVVLTAAHQTNGAIILGTAVLIALRVSQK